MPSPCLNKDIKIAPAEGRVTVSFDGKTIASSTRALELDEPGAQADEHAFDRIRHAEPVGAQRVRRGSARPALSGARIGRLLGHHRRRAPHGGAQGKGYVARGIGGDGAVRPRQARARGDCARFDDPAGGNRKAESVL